MVNRNGRWYVAGHDLTAASRGCSGSAASTGEVAFAGPAGSVTVPPGTDVREMRRRVGPEPPGRRATAVLRVRAGRRATACAATPRRSGPDPEHPGWDLAELPFSEVGLFADLLASFGADVVALEPTDLREAVIRKLKGVLA